MSNAPLLAVQDLVKDYQGLRPLRMKSLALSPGSTQQGTLVEGEQRRYRLSVPGTANYVLAMESDGLDSLLSVQRDAAGNLLELLEEPRPDAGQLIEVRGGGQSVQVGRFLRSDLRPLLAREIRLALRGA